MPDVVHRYRALLAVKENVCFCHNLAASNSGGDQDLPKGDRGERVQCEPKRGSGAEPPAGSRGRAPGRGTSGGEAPLELKAFCTFFIQKSGQKLSS